MIHPRSLGRVWPWASLGASSILLAFLALPLAALVILTGAGALLAGFRNALVWPALRLSLFTTGVSLAVIVGLGTPLAWQLARHRGRAGRAIETLVQLPIVVPPAVAGVALLLAFGRHGLLQRLVPGTPSLAFGTPAVILAETFVATPFFVQSAVSAFRRIDAQVLISARSLGATPLLVFVAIELPLAAPGLLAGAAMSWARALGEFGATLMFAGNSAGTTQTLPLAIYTALESDLDTAQALALILVVVAFGLLLVVRSAAARVP
jgi:molybdate transport system permease protein